MKKGKRSNIKMRFHMQIMYLLQKRRQQEENALREAEIKREMEEKRRIIEEEKRQAEIKREAEQRLKEEEERKRKEAEEEERRRREEEEREKRKKKQIPEWKRRMLERQKAEKSKPSKKTSAVSKVSTGKGDDSEGAAEVAEKLGSLRRGLEKKQGQLKEEAKEAKKGPTGKPQKKS